ncbi:MAG: MoxR family ATPase [Ruminococcus sp.]|nr:MoxR family ATPase [Ruminococcus sp.]
MNIKEAKEQIEFAIKSYLITDEWGDYLISLEKQRPVFLMGPPGIGKTAIMDQIAQDLQINLVSYAMTHQTRESAIGQPMIVDKNFIGREVKVSESTMSEVIANIYETMEETGIRQGLLFLDEINCVDRSIAPMMLQFLQYKIFGKHQIPEGWVVATAGNPPEYNHAVTEFDIATLDRLKKVDCDPDFGCWKEFALKAQLHTSIISYLTLNPDNFYGVDPEDDLIEKKKLNPNATPDFVTSRAWEDMSEMIYLYERGGIPVDLILIEQYIQDHDIAVDYEDFYRFYNEIKDTMQIDSILKGTASNDLMAKAQSLEGEALAIFLDILTAEISGAMQYSREMTRLVTEMQPLIQDAVERLGEGFSNREVYSNKIMLRQRELEKMIIARVISSSNKKVERWIIHTLENYLDETTNARDNRRAILMSMQMFDEKVKEVKAITKGAVSIFFSVVRFIIDVYGVGNELGTIFTNLGLNANAVKFIRTYGFEDFMNNPTGPIPEADLSAFDEIVINYQVEDPRAKYQQNVNPYA